MRKVSIRVALARIGDAVVPCVGVDGGGGLLAIATTKTVAATEIYHAATVTAGQHLMLLQQRREESAGQQGLHLLLLLLLRFSRTVLLARVCTISMLVLRSVLRGGCGRMHLSAGVLRVEARGGQLCLLRGQKLLLRLQVGGPLHLLQLQLGGCLSLHGRRVLGGRVGGCCCHRGGVALLRLRLPQLLLLLRLLRVSVRI